MPKKKLPSKKTSAKSQRLAHMTYFRLVDRSPRTLERFMQLCVEYLSEHKGQVHFSLGARATEMVREVNNLVFDVAMNMIFESIEDYLNYQHDPRHLEFITMSAGMSSTRSVFDSYIEDELPVKVAAKKASSTKHK